MFGAHFDLYMMANHKLQGAPKGAYTGLHKGSFTEIYFFDIVEIVGLFYAT